MSESEDIFSGITNVAKKWTEAKRKADNQDRVTRSQYRYVYSDRVTIVEVANEIMEEAYNKASSNGKYYANARQIFYAARPLILARATASKLKSSYFTQTLLKNYIEEYAPPWADNVVWDARGHFAEPHGGEALGNGGAEVRQYVASFRDPVVGKPDWDVTGGPTLKGPAANYAGVLFVEKEGFNQVLEQSGLLSRYDLALMSTKGMPVKAACDLLFALDSEVKIFVLHDFDKSGFTIVKTLREGTRLSTGVEVIDMGLRLEDIEGLEREPVSMKGDARAYLMNETDATPEEVSILAAQVRYSNTYGERVELNAMTSEQFVQFIERKVQESGIKKVIPDEEILRQSYRVAVQKERLREVIEKHLEEFDAEDVSHPDELRAEVARILQEHPSMHWPEAIEQMAGEDR